MPSHLTFYVFQKQEKPAGYFVVVALGKCVSGDQVVSLVVKAVPEKQNFVHYRCEKLFDVLSSALAVWNLSPLQSLLTLRSLMGLRLPRL